MDIFLRTCAAALVAVILILILKKQGSDWSVVLALLVCCMILIVACSFLAPVLDFLRQLRTLTGLDPDLLIVLLKAAGIGLVGEIAALICQDSGNSALGKGIQILSSVVILWLSIPLFERMLALLQRILGVI